MNKIVILSLIALVVAAMPFVSVLQGNLDNAQGARIWGGAPGGGDTGVCKKCPDNPNSTCDKYPCTYTAAREDRPAGCSEGSGGSFKVCEQATSKDLSCLNDDRVSCGTMKTCAKDERGCDASHYVCTCHESPEERDGCA